MMTRSNIRNSKRGNAAVEMAVSVPVLLAMVLGAIDFGRLHFEAMVVENASTVGSFYGAQAIRYAGDSTGIRNATRGEAVDIDGFTATHDVICQCLDGNGSYNSGVTQASCGDADCGTYGAPRVYVRARARKTFSTLGWYPGVPQSTAMDSRAWVRVQ